jgi:tRNA A37 methylthiotransferase MiaB
MSTFQVLNFGCRASQADGAALKRQLLDAGLREAPGTDASQIADAMVRDALMYSKWGAA